MKHVTDRATEFEMLAELLETVPRDGAVAQRRFLRMRCGGNERLYAEACSLLEYESRVPPGFLDPPRRTRRRQGPPKWIGPYRVLGVLGTGGMGDVYEASDSFTDRAIAIKVIRSGATSEEMTRRFDAEGRTLARMTHAGIARVYRVDQTDEGEPYLAMELVRDPIPITELAARERLDRRARVRLMIDVCDAVHHAHQKGVVHRDLKPGNLVASAEPEPGPRVRVIDFGVAKIVNEAAVGDLQTRVGQRIGTHAYMAPEQAADPTDVDVRSDVFSLGVVLYELLSRRRPFLGAGGPTPKPPCRDRPDALPETGRGRAISLDDLDRVVLKAIAEDREDRYESAAALADDLRRVLDRQPVAARPDSRLYRMQRFVGRNLSGVLAATAALCLVLATALGATFQAIRATSAERQERHHAYAASIVAAAKAFTDGNVASVRRNLELAPESLRGWEWRHLMALSDESDVELGPLDEPVQALHVLDGRWCIVRSAHRPVRVWPLGRPEASVRLPGDDVMAIGGAMGLVITAGSSRVESWDPATGERRAGVEIAAGVRAMGTGPAGIRVLDARGELWAVAVGRDGALSAPVAVATLDPRTAATVQSSEDGRRALLHGAGTARILDLDSGRVRLEAGGGELGTVTRAALAPSGGLVALAWSSGAIEVVDDEGITLIDVDRSGRDRITALAFDPSETRLVLGTDSGALYTHDVDGVDGGWRRFLGHIDAVSSIAGVGRGRVATSGLDGTVRLWALDEPPVEEVRLLDGETVTGLAFVGDVLLTVGFRTPFRSHEWFDPGGVTRIVYDTTDGYRLATLDDGARWAGTTVGGSLILGDLDGGVVRVPLGTDQIVDGMLVQPESGTIVCHAFGGALMLIDAETGEVLVEREARVLSAGPGPGGGILAAGQDRDVVAWAPDLGEELARLELDEHVAAAAYSSLLDIVAVGLDDGDILVYDRTLTIPLALLRGHGTVITALLFDPVSGRLVSGSDDATVRVWDCELGLELVRIDMPDHVRAMAWGDDGAVLGVVTGDGVRILGAPR